MKVWLTLDMIRDAGDFNQPIAVSNRPGLWLIKERPDIRHYSTGAWVEAEPADDRARLSAGA